MPAGGRWLRVARVRARASATANAECLGEEDLLFSGDGAAVVRCSVRRSCGEACLFVRAAAFQRFSLRCRERAVCNSLRFCACRFMPAPRNVCQMVSPGAAVRPYVLAAFLFLYACGGSGTVVCTCDENPCRALIARRRQAPLVLFTTTVPSIAATHCDHVCTAQLSSRCDRRRSTHMRIAC